MNCTINGTGFQKNPRAQLNERTGEEIVDADIREQLKKTE